jgi:hypothetical protein
VANRPRYVKPAAEIEASFSLSVTVDAYECLYRGESVALDRPGPWVRSDFNTWSQAPTP